jgi:hypothetical protein
MMYTCGKVSTTGRTLEKYGICYMSQSDVTRLRVWRASATVHVDRAERPQHVHCQLKN